MARQTPKDKAIGIFINYTKSLEAVSGVKTGTIWKAAVKDSLIKYVGPATSFIKVLDEMYFTTASYKEVKSNQVSKIWLDSTSKGMIKVHTYNDEKKQNFVDFLQTVIDYVDAHDIYVPPKEHNNFLGKFTNPTIIGWGSGILATITVIIVWIVSGVVSGKQDKESNEKITDLKNEVHDLKIKFEKEEEKSFKNYDEAQDYRLKSEELQYKYDSLLQTLPKKKHP